MTTNTLNATRENEARDAYFKLLEHKGADNETLMERNKFLQKLIHELVGKPADGLVYREVVETVMEGTEKSEWSFKLSVAREYYPFWIKDIKVIAAMNALGPELSSEVPLPGDARFSAEVEAWQTRSGSSTEDAVLFTTLAELQNPGAEIKTLIAGARAGELSVTDDPRSQWLGQLAQRLFGPNGPLVKGLK